jgi:hypothetical protein
LSWLAGVVVAFVALVVVVVVACLPLRDML